MTKKEYIGAFLDGYFSDKQVRYGFKYFSMLEEAEKQSKKKMETLQKTNTMTLREKFQKVFLPEITDLGGELLENVADEFALGFAEWYLNLSKSDDWEKFDYNTNEKLLKMYKRENEL
jgi:hypothetical protein